MINQKNAALTKVLNPSFKGFSQKHPNKYIWKILVKKIVEQGESSDIVDKEEVSTGVTLLDFQSLAKASALQTVENVSSSSNISPADMNRILEEIMQDRKCTKEEAFTALALLAQMGATSARTNDGVQVTVNSTIFYIELIRKIIKKITRKNLRRLAKSFASEFHIVAKNHKMIGNLFNKITLHYSDFAVKDEEKSWVSDFQSENENCPAHIREYLAKYYTDHIQPNTKSNINNNKKKK